MSESIFTDLSPQALFDRGKALINDSDEGLALVVEARRQAEAAGLYQLFCEISIFLSRTFRFQGKKFESIGQLNKAYRVLNQHIPNDQTTLALIYKEYGGIYSDGFQDFTTGLSYTLKGLSLDIAEIKTSLYNNAGCQYIYLKEYEKAFSFLEKGRRLSAERKEDDVLCFIYENLGTLFKIQGKYEQAITYFELGLASCEAAYRSYSSYQDVAYIHCYIQIGLVETYFAYGQLDEIPALIQEVCERAASSNLQSALSQVYLLEGKLLLKRNQEVAFEELFHQSLRFCDENSFYGDKEKWLEAIIDLYEHRGNYREALAYSKMIISNREEQKLKTKSANLANVLENKEIEILELENRNREVQLQKEQLEQFAYIVAHDLKTPLSNISNFIGLFSSTYREKVDAQNRFYLDFVLDNTKHLHEMLDDLLRYITLKDAKGNLPSCDVEKMLIRITENQAEEIKRKNAKIEYAFLPKVKIHAFHLESILNNLIHNALKFSKKEKATHIMIDLVENSSVYQFCIKDNGIGIQAAYYDRIFDVFKRLDKVNYKGTGMGLSICKKIIHTYGGKIWVSGNEMGGASFHFTIPKEVGE